MIGGGMIRHAQRPMQKPGQRFSLITGKAALTNRSLTLNADVLLSRVVPRMAGMLRALLSKGS